MQIASNKIITRIIISFCSIIENQCLEVYFPCTGHKTTIMINAIESILDFLLIQIGDKISKKGIMVSGVYVKGIINPHNDRKAESGVKVFYSMAYCLNRRSGVFGSISISMNFTFQSKVLQISKMKQIQEKKIVRVMRYFEQVERIKIHEIYIEFIIKFRLKSFFIFMKGNETSDRVKMFEVSNSNLKCYFMQNKLLQVSETKKNHIILTLDQNIRFSVSKLNTTSKKIRFLLNLRRLSSQIQLKIQCQSDLQYCIKYVGVYGIGYGLQTITQTFDKIGQGNFASVYKFVSTFNSVKAMKKFQKKKLERNKNKLNFQNQANIMRQLNSPYLAHLDCIFETEKNFYLQMEYFDQTLKSFSKRPMTRNKQKIIMKNLLEALQQLKNNRIVHRDIKPDNIMVRRNGTKGEQFVIIDFGLATKIHGQHLVNKCGTPGFIAPQILNMKDNIFINQKCDMFSLGVTFFYMQPFDLLRLTNKKPFSASDPRQMLQKNKKMILEGHLFSFLSVRQSDLVRRMIEKDPVKRISVEEALQHEYFLEQADENDIISEQNCDLSKKLKQIKIMDSSSMSEGVILLFSIFRLASQKKQTPINYEATKCYSESELKDLEVDEKTWSEEEVPQSVNLDKINVAYKDQI